MIVPAAPVTPARADAADGASGTFNACRGFEVSSRARICPWHPRPLLAQFPGHGASRTLNARFCLGCAGERKRRRAKQHAGSMPATAVLAGAVRAEVVPLSVRSGWRGRTVGFCRRPPAEGLQCICLLGGRMRHDISSSSHD